MNQNDLPPNDPSRQPGESDYPQSNIPMARPVSAAVEIPVGRPLLPENSGGTNPMLLERLSPAVCVLNLLAVLGAFVASSFVVGVSISAREGFDPEHPEASMNILDMLPIGIITVLVMILLLRVEKVPLSAIGLTGWQPSKAGINVLLGLAATAAAFGAFLVSVTVMSWFWPDIESQFEENTTNIDRIVPKAHPLVLLGVMCCVAIYEEIIFRGILLTHVRRILRSWTAAVLVAGVVFGVIHIGGEVSQVRVAAVPLGLVGVAWSLFSIWRRSLLPAIIGHMLFNFVQIMILFQMAPQPGPPASPPVPGLWLIRLGRSLASAAGFC